jgi:hypothetical protein
MDAKDFLIAESLGKKKKLAWEKLNLYICKPKKKINDKKTW